MCGSRRSMSGGTVKQQRRVVYPIVLALVFTFGMMIFGLISANI